VKKVLERLVRRRVLGDGPGTLIYPFGFLDAMSIGICLVRLLSVGSMRKVQSSTWAERSICQNREQTRRSPSDAGP
jgi:hypothetical protein